MILIFSIQVIFFTMNILSPVFLLPPPKFICNGVECSENNGGCLNKILNNPLRNTLTIQFNLYCERRNLRDLTQSIGYVGSFFGMLVLGFISDNFGRKKALISALLSSFSGLIVLGFSNNFYMAVIGYFFAGTGNFAFIFFQFILVSESMGIYFIK